MRQRTRRERWQEHYALWLDMVRFWAVCLIPATPIAMLWFWLAWDVHLSTTTLVAISVSALFILFSALVSLAAFLSNNGADWDYLP